MNSSYTVNLTPPLKLLADDFFNPYKPNYHKVYCHHDVDKMSYNISWHFDRGLSLKFFFYLNDVGRETGLLLMILEAIFLIP